MDVLLRIVTATPDGGEGGIELLAVMVPALVVLGRSCRELLRPRPGVGRAARR